MKHGRTDADRARILAETRYQLACSGPARNRQELEARRRAIANIERAQRELILERRIKKLEVQVARLSDGDGR